jgi:hypothetical protein
MQKYRGVILIPEFGRQPLHHAYCAPYGELDRYKTRTHPKHRRAYPNAFSVVNVMQGPREEKAEQIKRGMQDGDILLYMGWWPSPCQKWVATATSEVYGPEEGFAPSSPTPRYPLHEVVVRHPQPVFQWHPVFDPSGIANYEVMIDDTTHRTGTETTWTLASTLTSGEHVWRVRAVDRRGNAGEWSIAKTFVVASDGADGVSTR